MWRKTCVWLAAYTAIPLQGQTPASEDNWPRFRGPDAGVVDDDPALPERWSTTENVAWKVDLPGAACCPRHVQGRGGGCGHRTP